MARQEGTEESLYIKECETSSILFFTLFVWRVVNAVRSMPRNGASFPFVRTGGMKSMYY